MYMMNYLLFELTHIFYSDHGPLECLLFEQGHMKYFFFSLTVENYYF